MTTQTPDPNGSTTKIRLGRSLALPVVNSAQGEGEAPAEPKHVRLSQPLIESPHPSDPAITREQDVVRYSNADASPVPETCAIAVEAPVTIEVAGADAFTLMCSPHEKRALAAGFLLTEGLISGLDDVGCLAECPDDPNVIRVQLTNTPDVSGRNLLITSSCGLCGSKKIEEVLAALPKAGDTLRLPASALHTAQDSLRAAQQTFIGTGGTHAAGVFDAEGTLLAFAEDIGRHNALDKAIGTCLLRGIPMQGHAAALSGRVSLEMVVKCARAGLELIAAVSAPTSLAVEAADHSAITLCAFVRKDRATAFTHPHRVTS